MRSLAEDVLEEALEDYGIEDFELTIGADGPHLEVLCSTHDMERDATIRWIAELAGLKLNLVSAGARYDDVWEAG